MAADRVRTCWQCVYFQNMATEVDRERYRMGFGCQRGMLPGYRDEETAGLGHESDPPPPHPYFDDIESEKTAFKPCSMFRAEFGSDSPNFTFPTPQNIPIAFQRYIEAKLADHLNPDYVARFPIAKLFEAMEKINEQDP